MLTLLELQHKEMESELDYISMYREISVCSTLRCNVNKTLSATSEIRYQQHWALMLTVA
jgi:hypothetical protein